MGKRKRRHSSLSIVREPNGRHQRGEREFSPGHVRRLRDAALSSMADARWGSELGRLLLSGKITEAGFAAGEKWAKLATQYRAAIGAPSNLRSASLERGSLGTAADPDSAAGAVLVAHETVILKRMERAHAALCRAGKLAEYAVRRTCERNEATGGFDLIYLVDGLMELAKHWSIDGKFMGSHNVK